MSQTDARHSIAKDLCVVKKMVYLDKHRANRRLIAALLAANIAVIGIVSFALRQSYNQVEQKGIETVDSFSSILESNLSTIIRSIDITLLAVIDEYLRQISNGAANHQDLTNYIERFNSRLPETLGLRIVNADGKVIYPIDENQSPSLNLKDREYFQKLKSSQSDGIYVSPPVLGRIANKYIIIFARRINNSDGSFAGLAYISIETDVLDKILSSIKVGEHGVVSLWNANPNTIARFPNAFEPGFLVNHPPPPSPELKAIIGRDEKSIFYQAVSGTDSLLRYYHLRKVGTYPLYAIVGLADTDIMADWRKQRTQISLMTGLFLLLTLVIWQLFKRVTDGAAETEKLRAEQQAQNKITEEVIQKALDAAIQSSQSKSQFLATMSHEIRSPMSGMIGVLDLLSATNLDKDQIHMTQLVQRSSTTLLEVLNDILDYSKIEAGALSLAMEAVTLRDLLHEVVAPFRSATKNHVTIDLSVSPAVPAYVELDPLRLRQIINNLISNAIKFTEFGIITITVDLSTEGDHVVFNVADTGVGMTPAVVERLFQPFMQADSSTSRNFGGTGLGLSISHRLAHLHGGALSVSSEAGVGSVFTLTLPLIAAASAKPTASPVAIKTDDWTANFTVLVVDDDLTNRWLTQRQLQRLGFNVQSAEDGESGLALLQSQHFDLLLTDCHMPRMDGVALTRAVRHADDPHLRSLPVIGLTADVTETQRERCEQAGMTLLAIKPLALDKLQTMMTRLLLASSATSHPTTETAPEPAQAAPLAFDRANFDDLFPPDDEEGPEWLASYLAAADHLMAEIRSFLPIAAPDQIKRIELAATSHRLVGSSLSVGANAFGLSARELERAAATADSVVLHEMHETLIDQYTDAKRAITDLIASLKLEQPIA